MLSNKQIEKLKANWGEKADSVFCMAEIRLYDPLSLWECYLLSLNPDDEDEVVCIVKIGRNCSPSVETWSLKNIRGLFNQNGEGVLVDEEYRPRFSTELIKQLKEQG